MQLAAETPARLFGISDRKGALAPGRDADLVIVDDHVDEMIDCAAFLSKAKYSPFHARRVTARVDLTMVRGRTVYADGMVNEDAQRGRLLRRRGSCRRRGGFQVRLHMITPSSLTQTRSPSRSRLGTQVNGLIGVILC